MSDAGQSKNVACNRQIDEIRGFYRDVPQTSDWFEVTQDMVDQFGQSTFDTHWIHSDPAKAARESPYGNTIAHGFWTLAMLTYLSQKITGPEYPPGTLFGLNYGLDRVRFPGPAPVGSRIRLKINLVDIEDRGDGRYVVKTHNEVEVEGQPKPAVAADWLFMLVYSTVAAN